MGCGCAPCRPCRRRPDHDGRPTFLSAQASRNDANETSGQECPWSTLPPRRSTPKSGRVAIETLPASLRVAPLSSVRPAAGAERCTSSALHLLPLRCTWHELRCKSWRLRCIGPPFLLHPSRPCDIDPVEFQRLGFLNRIRPVAVCPHSAATDALSRVIAQHWSFLADDALRITYFVSKVKDTLCTKPSSGAHRIRERQRSRDQAITSDASRFILAAYRSRFAAGER